MRRSLNAGVELLKKSIYLYYSIKIYTFRNKIRRLNTIKKIIYLIVLSGGGYLLLNRVLGRTTSVSDLSTNDTELTPFIYIFILLRLLFTGKFGLGEKDVDLIQLSNSVLNPLMGYRFISTVTKVFFPFIITLYIGVVQNSLANGVVAFLFLFFLVNITNGVSFLLQFCKLSLKTYIVRVINGVLAFMVFVLLIAYMSDLPVSSTMTLLVAPISTVLSSLIYGNNLVISHCGTYMILYMISYSLLFILFYGWLSSREYRLSLENEMKLPKSKVHLSGKRFTALEHQMIIVKMGIANKNKIISIMLPSIIYIFLSIYSFHIAFENREEVSNMNFIAAQWFALIGFPVIYILPNFRYDLKSLWIYRYSLRATRIFLISNLLKYYLSCVLSLVASCIIITLLLLCVYNANFFEFMNIPIWVLLTFFTPILFSLIGLLIALKLPDVYFGANGHCMSIVPMIAFIWLIGLVTSPILISLIGGYNLISLLSFIIISVIFFLVCRYTILKIEI